MEYQVTAAGPEDADQLAAVHVQGWREAYGHLLPERFYDHAARTARQALWQRTLADPVRRDQVRIGRLEHETGYETAGFAMAGPSREDADHPPSREEQLFALYIRAAHYGTGLGALLLEAVLGDRPGLLWVARDNPRARRFYEKHGFRAAGAELTDPRLEGITEIRMVR